MPYDNPKKKKGKAMRSLTKQAKTIVSKQMIERPMPKRAGGKKTLIPDLPYIPRP